MGRKPGHDHVPSTSFCHPVLPRCSFRFSTPSRMSLVRPALVAPGSRCSWLIARTEAHESDVASRIDGVNVQVGDEVS